jgi:MFS family permease
MNKGRERALILAPPLLWVAAAIVLWPGPWDRLADPWFVASVPFYIAATVLLIKAPANSIGWMMMGFPATTAVAVMGTAIAVEAGEATLLASWADTIGISFATPSIMFLPLMFLYFPDGLLPSPRWRFGRNVILAGAAIGSLAALLNGGWGGDPEAGSLESPLRTATMPVGDVLSNLFFIAMILSFVIGGAALVHRFLRSEGPERNQIKWVALAGACVAAILTLLLILFGLEAVDQTWGELLLVAGVVAVPTAVAIAVLRYRLYEIDRLLSRTVGYVVVLGVLTAVYVVGAVWLPTRLLGEQSPLFVAASTLTVAGLFGPLRRRVLVWVDRRFYRARYDADRVAEAFSSRLRDQIDLTDLTADWVGVVTSTLRPSTIGVWVSERSSD